DRNRSHWSTSKTPSYTKSVSWQHHLTCDYLFKVFSVTVFERASEVKIIFLIVMWDVIRMASLMFMVTPYVCSGIDR
ncbi:hypothetical protein OFN39_14005, partial [Escherichia coli]|nr:hypothetical protein [Escherichia coli]